MKWDEKTSQMVHDEDSIQGFVGEYRFLSNFQPCEIEFEGRTYSCTENAYAAAKCELDSEKDKFVNITAGQAKRLGRSVLMRSDWDKVKEGIMEELVTIKFTYNEELKKKLLATGNKYLEETNWWGDKFWGVCNGVGQNKLGKILMRVREKLKS
jgi:hypothetical protein